MSRSNPETIVEIGPGEGALTELLLEAGAMVHAIELDPAMVAHLAERFRAHPRLTVHTADVLSVDLGQWGPAVLAGNLPYYITSPILDRIFQARVALSEAILLIQREVADRLAAKPNSRDYGYLSVVAQTWADVEMVTKVPPGAFRPPPKVDSAVVRLRLKTGTDPDTARFLRFAGLAFRQKRKMLRSNLAGEYPKATPEQFPELKLRAEQLSIGELRAFWQRLEAAR